MTAWQLRRATPADLGAIMLIEDASFPTDAWSERGMAAELSHRHGYYVVAHPVDERQRIDGYAGILAPRGAQEADVQTIAVAERARGAGLGRALLGALVGEAGRRGARELFLEVRADNPVARSLYLSAGFEELGVRKAYYQPDGVDAIVMRLSLPTPAVSTAASVPAEKTVDERHDA
jgi:[ribosomal protein S18]-alanine N-acetyltransferase